MPRPLRPIADGLIYHVINRGNNRQTVFSSEGDFGTASYTTADSPAPYLKPWVRSCRVNQEFMDYLMYKPTGTNSIWVTLRTMDWSWKARAMSLAIPPLPGRSFEPDWSVPSTTVWVWARTGSGLRFVLCLAKYKT